MGCIAPIGFIICGFIIICCAAYGFLRYIFCIAIGSYGLYLLEAGFAEYFIPGGIPLMSI